MQIITKKEAKTAVSALRRELKSLGKTPDQLSHSDCLTLLAKALGHASWNEWESKLEDDASLPAAAQPADAAPATVPSRYPLSNDDGRFDFVPKGAAGAPHSAWFERLQGTHETLPGIALVNSATRGDTKLRLNYEGTTDIDWDGQKPDRKDGVTLWADESANRIPATSLILLPEDYCGDYASVYEDEELPVREALVAEFAEYFAANALLAKLSQCKTQKEAARVTGAAEKLLGFWLTQRELAEALRRAEG